MNAHTHPHFDDIPSWLQEVIALYFPYDPINLDQKKAIQLKNNHLQNEIKCLYKYKGIDDNRLAEKDYLDYLEELLSGKLFTKNPESFNDPFDYYATSIDTDKLKKSVLNSIEDIDTVLQNNTIKQIQHFCKPIPDLFVEVMKAKVQVDCFTINPTNLLLWSHYSWGHKGICIEYDLNSSQVDATIIERIMPVIYTQKMLDISPYLTSMIANFISSARTNINLIRTHQAIKDKLNPWAAFLIGLVKSKCWEYEKEWRFIDRSSVESNSNYYLPVKSVYIGYKATSATYQALAKLARRKKIALYKMQRHTELYTVYPVAH